MSWSRFLRRKSWDAERARELEAYLEFETADNLARGMPLQEARAAARRKLGNPTLIREEIYSMNTVRFLETVWQDLRYAGRVLRKSPGFTLAAVLSLALGIGANTAIFSVVHAVLLRPLPFPQPDRLVHVGQPDTQNAVSMSEFEFWKEHSSAFASVAGDRGVANRALDTGARVEWIGAMMVTGDFFRTLGVAPALGREFKPEETQAGGPQAIVVSDGLWRRVFGADPQAPGRVVKLDNTSYTVAGVLPRGFWLPQAADAFVPLRLSGTAGDLGANTAMIARLKPGVSLKQAQAEMATLTQNYRLSHGLGKKYRGLLAIPYREWLTGDVRLNLLLLFGAVGLLLLIACSNLASLMLARLAARQKEIALRIALGSGTGRLLRQFLTENILLGIAGSAAGLFGAYLLLDSFVALIPFKLPLAGPVRLDLPVLGFTLAVAFGTSLLFSLAPFFATSRTSVHETLKSAGRSMGTSPARQRMRSLLVAGEVALSVTLLAGAALLIQSLYLINRERLGFTSHGVITFFTPATPAGRRNPELLRNFEAALLERLKATPGVRAAATVSSLPLTGQSNFPVEREGHPENGIGGMEIRIVSPGYFETMRIPILRGRSLTSRDTATAPPVILVNATVARKWWARENPLGDRVFVGRYRGQALPGVDEPPREVVGVVADTKSVYLKEPPRTTVYLPSAQTPWYDSGMNWVVRGEFPPAFAARLRQIVTEIDARQRVDRVRTMDEIVARTTADSRFDAWLFGSFAGLALLLTSIGVYGLLSFSVARRVNEIGTRMALGASRAHVLRLVLRQGLALVLTGLVVGLAGALALTRTLSGLLYGVRATDPATFVAVSILLLGVGLLASYLPARRATKVDPIAALRCE